MRKRGTGSITAQGYLELYINGKKKHEHVLVAEKALGRELPKGCEVHHVNEDRLDNRPENLVICPNKAYHKLLHVRTDALKACGNANYRKCPFCKEYGDPETMGYNKSSSFFYHRACKNEYDKNRYHKRQEQLQSS